MKIRVLGPLEVEVEDRVIALGGPRQRALFALLVAEAPNSVSADALIARIWGEDAPAGNRSSLQTYVSKLRHLLGGRVLFDRGSYRLDLDQAEVDAHDFVSTLTAARTRVATDPEGVSRDLREALALWRGRPYSDLADIPGLDQEVRRLEAQRLEAVELRIDSELGSGHHAELVAEIEALAEEHPTRERFRAQHMLALYRSGRQAEALRAYRRTETYLADELGVSPSRELQDLELRILEQDESLSAGVSTPVTRRLAFLVTDIEGSTKHWDRFPQAMAAALSTHDTILREEVERAGGRVFKHTGDGVLAVLPDAVAAADAAEGIQTRLARADWDEIGDLRVRIGIDAGEAEERGGDFFGPPLNRAARLCAIGHGGQVLISSAAERDVTANAPAGLQVRHLGEVHLRGMATPERIAQLVFVGLPAEFPGLRLEADSALDGRSDLMSLPGYEVRDRIGEGAFGVVWRAYQPSVGREVAVKVIRPELASEPSFVRRFEAEARTIARLAHPHIVPLIDFWRGTDSAYLVLALLPGGSLASAIRGAHIDAASSRRILTQLATALDHAHSQGIAHGDLKAANVLLDGFGNAYLSDFGIAARLVDPDVFHSVSSAPQYRAPEEAATGPTPAADRFALGVLAGEMLGAHPEIESVLSRATAAHPGDRFPSAVAFMRDLEEAMGADADALPHPTVTRNPYKGLRAFDEGDASDFHGRDDLVAAVLAGLGRNRFVTVVGPSGSGKSSVVRSGVIPRLAEGGGEELDRSLPITFTPGSDPVLALFNALPSTNGHQPFSDENADWLAQLVMDGEPVLVVDQFEELYTQVDDPDTRRRFVDMLLAVMDNGGRVLATLRADYYDRPLGDERIAPLIRDGQVTVVPPTRDELVEMVTAPARAVGLRWEPGLAHRIVEDVAHQPGGLPLLQYALTELVERRAADLLTASDYHRIGEVTGALANRAESLFAQLTPAQQSAARQILLRLVTVDEDTDASRRRVRRSELESLGIGPADLDHILDVFTTERLLLGDRDPVSRTPTVEVSHEALLREWPRLRGWIEDHREGLLLGRRFRAAMTEWESNERDDDYLLGGSRLAAFVGWSETSSLTPDERAFYDASRARDQAERASRRRRRRTLIGVLAGAAIVAIVLGSVAAIQAARATDEADAARVAEDLAEAEARRANDNAEIARSRELLAAAEANLGTNPSLARLLAVTATEDQAPTPDSLSMLHRVHAADRVQQRFQFSVGTLDRATISPPGTQVVLKGWAGEGQHAVPLLQLAGVGGSDQTTLWSAPEPGVFISDAFFSEDGGEVIASVFREVDLPRPENEVSSEVPLGVHIWDSRTGELLNRIDVGPCGGFVEHFASGVALVSVDQDATCLIEPELVLIALDLDSGERRVVADDVRFPPRLSGDGRRVAFTTSSTTIVADVATGERLLEFPRDDHPLGLDVGFAQALNDDGSLLVVGQRPMAVWDVAARERIAEFHQHPGNSWAWGFGGPDGTDVISSGQEGSVRIWSAKTGIEVASFNSLGFGAVALAEDGRFLVTDWDTDTAVLVEPETQGEAWAVPSCGVLVPSDGLDIAGDTALLVDYCEGDMATSYVIDLDRREIASTHSGFVTQDQAISPGGKLFVRQEAVPQPAGESRDLPLWIGPPVVREVETGDVVSRLEGVCTWGRTDANDGPEGDNCAELPDTPFPMWSWQATFSPDSSTIVIKNQAADSFQIAAWDAVTGDLLWTNPSCHGNQLFSPDGSELLVPCESTIEVLAPRSGELLRSVDGGSAMDEWGGWRPVGYSADGTVVMVSLNAGGTIFWLDAETLEVVDQRVSTDDATPKAWDISPDGSTMALGFSDGFIDVWSLTERQIVQEIFVADTQVQGVAFIDADHLAVSPQSGGMAVYVLDPTELRDVVAESLTRGFTSVECERYGFGTNCPTLDELVDG